MDKCTKYINLFLFSLFQSCTQHFYHGRQYGNHNNGHNQQFEVLLYKRKVTEEITRITEDGNPAGAPNQVVQHEVIVIHLSIPATNGANVRTIGTKRAMIIVLPPYFL